MIRILIADDHSIFRHGLKQILEESGVASVVAEASSGNEVMQWLRANDCEVLLLDISMPGMNGFDVLKLVREEKPLLPALVLSIYAEDQYAVRMIEAGAFGYMTKESAPAEVVEAVCCVAEGRPYITPVVKKLLAAQRDEALSEREYQIFLLLASAQTVSEIAQALSLSVNTISTYRKRILEKMHLQNNAELMHYAISRGLVK